MNYRLLVLLICTSVHAEDRFYTTVDAQGRVQIIKSEVVQKPNNSSKDSAETESKEQVAPMVTPAKQEHQKDLKDEKQGYRQMGEETYIDAELLEKKQFNIEDKKRFYYVPSLSSGSAVIETEDGKALPVKPFIPEVKAKNLDMKLSDMYRVLSTEEFKTLYPDIPECYDVKYLNKHSKPLVKTQSVWKSLAYDTKIQPDRILKIQSVSSANSLLVLTSFANTIKQPKFYVPTVAFLNKEGCLLSSVWNYWNQATRANQKQYASVAGLVQIPEQSAYIVFYQPSETLTGDIPLQRYTGSFVVDIYER